VDVSDLFGTRGRDLLRQRLQLLPPHTAYATQQLLEQIEGLDHRVRAFEQRIQAVFKPTPTIQLLLTMPGVGLTLAVVIALELGDVARFATAEKLAAYAGHTPRIHASGERVRNSSRFPTPEPAPGMGGESGAAALRLDGDPVGDAQVGDDAAFFGRHESARPGRHKARG
jgi:hypothetical protein